DGIRDATVTGVQTCALPICVDRNKIAQLEAQRKASEQQIAANRAKVDELQAKLAEADKTLFRATLDYNYMKATYDQDRYDFEATQADKGVDAAKKKGAAVEEEAKKLNGLDLAMQKAIADKAEVQKQLGVYTGQAV